ncbi:MAG: TIGR04086 family membrane protein [Thermoplasmata archaeon]|nr:TIGR04086 family membrane protein [Thermoplasmata archaeon]
MHVYEDKTTKKLMRRGVFSVSRRHHDREAKTFKDHAPFSVPQAIGLAFVLSILLYWLPIFGTMIAGYVCGRRAGTALKGAACGLIAGLVLFIVGYILVLDIFGAGTVLHTCQNAVWSWIQGANPVFASYCVLVSQWAEIISAIFRSFLITEPGNLVILVVFGYVGGAIAAQRYREAGAREQHFHSHESKPGHAWRFFNSRARYEPEKYYYVKAKKPERETYYVSRPVKTLEIEDEPVVVRKSPEKKEKRIQKKDVELQRQEEPGTFSDDEYYILGKAKPVEEVERGGEEDRRPVRGKRNRGTNSIVERAMKAREEEMERGNTRAEELGVL